MPKQICYQLLHLSHLLYQLQYGLNKMIQSPILIIMISEFQHQSLLIAVLHLWVPCNFNVMPVLLPTWYSSSLFSTYWLFIDLMGLALSYFCQFILYYFLVLNLGHKSNFFSWTHSDQLTDLTSFLLLSIPIPFFVWINQNLLL